MSSDQPLPSEKVTRLKAAERQLRVAIRMFFERKDLIAVHTLAAAAQGILQDLGKPKGYMSIFEEGMNFVFPEKRAELRRMLRQPQNDFKHADLDPNPNAEITFYSEQTQYCLFDASRLLLLHKGRHIRETAALSTYFWIKHPNVFKLDAMPEMKQRLSTIQPENLDFDVILLAMDSLKELE